jgi:serine/threonine-protein kinase
VQYARLIAEPLSFVHREGIIHRDVKPENVILISDPQLPWGERAKILDFGIAVLAESRHLEREDVVIGTPHYMAPEQCRGIGAHDGKIDVYALGVVLTEMIAGRPPFKGEDAVMLMGQHLSAVPPSLFDLVPAVSRRLSDFVARMLAKTSKERPTMEEVAQEMRRYERKWV